MAGAIAMADLAYVTGMEAMIFLAQISSRVVTAVSTCMQEAGEQLGSEVVKKMRNTLWTGGARQPVRGK